MAFLRGRRGPHRHIHFFWRARRATSDTSLGLVMRLGPSVVGNTAAIFKAGMALGTIHVRGRCAISIIWLSFCVAVVFVLHMPIVLRGKRGASDGWRGLKAHLGPFGRW